MLLLRPYSVSSHDSVASDDSTSTRSMLQPIEPVAKVDGKKGNVTCRLLSSHASHFLVASGTFASWLTITILLMEVN